LAIERQVLAVFRDQDMGEQPRSSKPSCNRARGRLHLHNALALGASELRAHVLDHAETRRHVFEYFGNILADLAQRRPTVGASACWRVFHAGARQMLR
jgi:hypothetical protein